MQIDMVARANKGLVTFEPVSEAAQIYTQTIFPVFRSRTTVFCYRRAAEWIRNMESMGLKVELIFAT